MMAALPVNLPEIKRGNRFITLIASSSSDRCGPLAFASMTSPDLFI